MIPRIERLFFAVVLSIMFLLVFMPLVMDYKIESLYSWLKILIWLGSGISIFVITYVKAHKIMEWLVKEV